MILRLLAAVVFPMFLIAQPAPSDLSDSIDGYFGRLTERGFSGAALVAQDGTILIDRGYGLADDSAQTPVTAQTVFDVGSVSKQFTAAAILHLEAQGKLSVDDTLSQYFEDVPADKASITIHHLLTHSAGFRDDHFEGDLTPMSRDEAQAAIFALPLGSAPGTEYAYSNSGYTLLAILIETVAGQPYQDYLHEHLFEPAGMQSTGFYGETRWDGLSVARTYLNGADQGIPADWPGPYWGVMGNGGIMSTTGDMYRWVTALQDGTILVSEDVERLFAPHIDEGGDSFYGYGWSIQQTDHGKLITHNGGGIGGNSDVAIYPDAGLVIIVLSNRIVYNIPLEVRLPASEASTQLAANILAQNFDALPAPTFVLWPYLGVLLALSAAIVATVIIIRRRSRT